MIAYSGRWSFSLVALLGFGFDSLFAQQVATDPASTHIFPAGGRRGTTVAVRVGGECLPPGTAFRLIVEGVFAPPTLERKIFEGLESSERRRPGETHINYPKEWDATLEIAADAPLGSVHWRLSSGRGGTGARPFLIGDLPEFIETESNSGPDRAELVVLPSTINGRIAGERDMDYFRFAAMAGQVVTADVVAGRIGSPLDPIVEFHDSAGRRQAAQQIKIGGDPIVALRVPADGEYRLVVSHVGYQGGPNYVYRITLSTEPFAAFAFPPGGRAGESHAVAIHTLTGGDEFAVAAAEIAIPSDASGTIDCPLPALGSRTVSIEAGDLPEVVETEPNDAAASATSLTVPATVNGRFSLAQDEDWYTFTAQAATPLAIECHRSPALSPVLPLLSIHDAAGALLASAGGIEPTPGRAEIAIWQPPADGEYRLRVRDVQQGIAGGPEFVYRLSIRPAVADFALSALLDIANVVQAGRAEVDVRLKRLGGFAGTVDLSVEGLPDGVRAEPAQFAAGVDALKLAIVADEGARPCAADLRIVGTAMLDGESATRVVSAAHLGRDVEGNSIGPGAIDAVQLTVQHKPVFKLYCNEAYQYAHRGTVYPYLMEVERLDGFDGPIALEIADRQIKDLDGVEVLPTVIRPGRSSAMLPVYLPETMHINVQAHSNVYAQGWVRFTDAWGQDQSLLVVSTMRCMIRTLPTVARLSPIERTVAASPGDEVACRLQVDRTTNFTGPMTIELVDPPPEIAAASTTIAADESTAEIRLRIDSAAAAPADRRLMFRATGELAGGARVVSECEIDLHLAAAVAAAIECGPPPAESGLKVGAAAVNLVADDSMDVGGGITAGRLMGQEGELRAVAVVLEHPQDGRLAIVACDVLMLNRDLLDPIVDEIARDCGIAAERIMINATHTHHAPSTVTIHGYKRDLVFCERVQRGIVEAVRQAVARLEGPATFHFRLGEESSVGQNSRLLLGDGTIFWIGPHDDAVRPTGPFDPELPVLAFRDRDEKLRALLFNHSTHTIGTRNGPVRSPSFYGLAAQELEAELGGTVCFLEGASGSTHNLGTPAAECTIRIKNAVLDALNRAESRPVERLAGIKRQFRYTVRYFDEEREQATVTAYCRKRSPTHADTIIQVFKDQRDVLAPQQGQERETWIQAIAIGDVAIVGVPAEFFTRLGQDIKRRSPFRHTYVAELANDWIGYLPDRAAFDLGGYQTWTGLHSFAEPGTGEAVVDEAVAILDELARDE